MSERTKILICEYDDFLREIIGNLLHKQGYYILNGDTIEHGLKRTEGHDIDIIIIGASCPDYRGKSSIHYLRQQKENPLFYFINDDTNEVPFLKSHEQQSIDTFSLKQLLEDIPKLTQQSSV